MPYAATPALPIDPILPEVRRVLGGTLNAVLQAPPGAGKTTRVPLALLDEPWLSGSKIVMLEPRRLAARAAARRMADTLGEAVGETVGYRVRMDSKVGPKTRIEVVTEGILIRLLQRDPALEGIGAVLFDEFHERSLDADLGLALCLQTQSVLRDDLRLLVMSATLDGTAVARLLDDAPVITSEGRAFPVETRHIDPSGARRIEDAVASATLRALDEETGNILVFLPGVAEIRRVEKLLAQASTGPGILIAPLYGDLPQDRQDAAIGPTPPGLRKIVLATSIAETSLTIEGIRVVIDSGLMRVSRFDPGSGMTRLETIKVSQASADQRRGRAGRLEPGVCYRLWPQGQHRALPLHTAPEMLAADLAPLALELAQWGVSDPADLRWLDPPPAPAYAQARDLLHRLGALDGGGKITAHGGNMASLGMHPRLAHMVLRARDLGCGGARLPACGIAGGTRYPDRPAGRAAGFRYPPPCRGATNRRPETLVGPAGRGAGAAVAAPAWHRGRHRKRSGHRAGAGAGLSRPHRPAASGKRRAVPAQQRARRLLPEDGAAGRRGLPCRRRSRRREARSPHLPGRPAHAARDRGGLRRHHRDGRVRRLGQPGGSGAGAPAAPAWRVGPEG